MMELMGIETIEDAINGYIENEVGRRLIADRVIRIGNIVGKEEESIQREIATYSGDKEAAESRLNEARAMFGNIIDLKNKTLAAQNKLHDSTLKQVTEILKQRLEKDLFSQTEEITTDAIIFMTHYAQGNSEQQAKKAVIRLNKNQDMVRTTFTIKEIKAISEERAQTSQKLMPGYIAERINDCINNFLDITIGFKDIYGSYQEELNKLTTQADSQVRERLNAILGLELESTMPDFIKEEYAGTFDAISIDTTPDLPPVYMDRSLGDKILGFFTLGWAGKGKPVIPIDYHGLHKQIKSMLDKKCQGFEENELEKHEKILKELKEKNQGNFQKAIQTQEEEVKELQRKLENEEEPLKKAELRKDAFHKSSEWLEQQPKNKE